MRRSRVAIALLVPALVAPPAAPGQTPAWVESCYDGDTCTFGGVRDTAVTVRLAGIDTPEMDGECRAAARRAKRALRRQLRSASVVRVKPVETGRYGRVIGRVYADSVDVSRWLKRRGLAVDYPGDTCPVSGAGVRELRDGGGALPYDPDGPDRDCGDFESRPVAQRFFEAAGGPAEDPHRLDGDDDGLACESLPGSIPSSVRLRIRDCAAVGSAPASGSPRRRSRLPLQQDPAPPDSGGFPEAREYAVRDQSSARPGVPEEKPGMFSISHSDDGAFRLEIHGSPSELDPEDARRLQAVLLGLAREVPVSGEDTSATSSTRRAGSAAARPGRSNG